MSIIHYYVIYIYSFQLAVLLPTVPVVTEVVKGIV